MFTNVKPGDTVHYLTPQGQRGKGKVVLKYDTHVVVNRGKGQPQVVNDKNYVKHERGGKVIGALLSRLKEDKANMDKHAAWMKKREKEIVDDRRGEAWERVHKQMPGLVTRLSARLRGTKLDKNGKYVKEATWQGAGDPYNWDPVARAQAFAAEKKAQKKPKGPQPNKLDTGRDYKPSYNPPPRRGTANEESLSEGNIPKVHGFENFKNMAHDWANYNDHHNGGRPLLHQQTVETDKVLHQTLSIGHHPRSGNPYIIGVFNHIGGPNSEEGHGTHHHYTQGLEMDEDSHDAEGSAERVAKTKKHKKRLVEVSAPGKEEWIKANKQRFIDRYGKEKGIKILYAKAWKDSKTNEAHESEYGANIQMAASAGKASKPAAKGHYLMRDGRKLSGPHSPEGAVKAYKDMSDSKGVKIVHVKEGVETDVTQMIMEASGTNKYKKAAEKAISLAKKAKGNKHVNTQPELNIQDKGGSGPIESNHQEEGDGKL